MKKPLSFLLALCLTFTLCAAPVSALDLEDAKKLLQESYVDELSQDVLNASSLEEMLEILGDPYTVYMTAEEYQSFLEQVNGDSVVGIGVSIQNVYEDGFAILSVLPNSPALEAGLEAGDRIVAVDGVPLTAGSSVGGAVAGEEGTPVTITVIRQADGSRQDYTMTRRAVTIPIVTYEQVDNAGVISCTSFGDSTVSVVQEALTTLDDSVDMWIMDLRSNPGGTSDAAVGSAGLFVGSAIMSYFRYADDEYTYVYTRPGYPDLTDKPLVILTSQYSASGSEMFSAAARDLGFGIAIGQRTYGKGVAQSVFDADNTEGLFDGDAMKITVSRFFSPDGTTNHVVGILPTLMISEENTAAVALLLSGAAPVRAGGWAKLELAGQTFYLDLSEAKQADNAAAFTELLEALPPSAALYRGSGTDTWTAVSPASLAASLNLSYTSRSFSDISRSPYARQIQTLAVYHLLDGYGDGTFQPDKTVTRAEFCAMVASALDFPANSAALTFSDTSGDAWYADAVSAMASRGLIAGYDDGTFRPDGTITYQEMVTILAAVAAWANIDGYALSKEEIPLNIWGKYSDFDVWAMVPARCLDELDALVGDQAPTDSGTREVAAALLCTLMENIHLIWD
jgi:C-terminal peptidase prc